MIVSGPGTVYFSADTVSRRSSEFVGGMNRGGQGNAMLMLRVISLVITTILIWTMTRVVEFEIIDARDLNGLQGHA